MKKSNLVKALACFTAATTAITGIPSVNITMGVSIVAKAAEEYKIITEATQEKKEIVTDGFWKEFSDYYQLTGDFDITFNINNQGGDNAWNNPVTVFTTAAERESENYKEYAVIRSDNWGWGGGDNFTFDGNAITYTNDWGEPDTLIAAMKNATIIKNIVRSGNEFAIEDTIKAEDGTIFTSTVNFTTAADETMNIFLTTDAASMTINSYSGNTLGGNTPEEPDNPGTTTGGAITNKYSVITEATEEKKEIIADGWWKEFSDYYQLTGDFDITFNISNQGGDNAWNNPVTVFTTAAERENENYKEYAVIRSDNWGWGGGDNFTLDGNAITYTNDWGEPDTLIAVMKNATIIKNIVRSGNEFAIEDTIKAEDGTIFTSTVNFTTAADETMNIFLTTDAASMTINSYSGNTLGGNTPEEPDTPDQPTEPDKPEEPDNPGTTTGGAIINKYSVITEATEEKKEIITDGFWEEFSDYYQLTGDFDITFNISNQGGDNAWNNPMTVFTTAAERESENYKEYALIRSDNFGWGGGNFENSNFTFDGNEITYTNDWEDFNLFIAAMKNATITKNIVRSGNEFVIEDTIKAEDGTIFTSTVNFTTAADETMNIFLTTDAASMIINSYSGNTLGGNTPEEPDTPDQPTEPDKPEEPDNPGTTTGGAITNKYSVITEATEEKKEIITDGFWEEFSDYYQLTGDFDITFNISNQGGDNTWNNPVTVFTTAAERESENYKEYALIRSDNFGWGGGNFENSNFTLDGNAITYTNDWGEPDTLIAAMKNATIIKNIVRSGNEFAIEDTIKAEDGTIFTSTVNFTTAADETMNIFLTTDTASMTINSYSGNTLGGNTPEEPDTPDQPTEPDKPEEPDNPGTTTGGAITNKYSVITEATEEKKEIIADGWWKEFSDYYQLTDNFNITFNISNQGGDNAWNNPVTVFTTAAERENENYKEYAVIRSDNWGWAGGDNLTFDGNVITYTNDWREIDAFIAAMKNAVITRNVTRNGNEFTIKDTITAKDGKIFTSTTRFTTAADKTMYLFFTTDTASMTINSYSGNTLGSNNQGGTTTPGGSTNTGGSTSSGGSSTGSSNTGNNTNNNKPSEDNNTSNTPSQNTTTETKPDGTKVETTTEIKTDGSKTETVTETKTDGSVKETVTETKQDGTSKETIKETKADGTKTELVKEIKIDGSSTETKKVTAGDNSATLQATTETDKEGNASTNAVISTGTANSGTVTISKDLLESAAESGKVDSLVVEISGQTVTGTTPSKANTVINISIPSVEGVNVDKVVLTGDSIAAAKGTGKGLKVNVVNESGDNYTVTIPVKQLAKIGISVDNLNLSIKADSASNVANEKKDLANAVIAGKGSQKNTCVVSIAENTAAANVGLKVAVPVTNKADIASNSTVYIYKYNAKTGKLEEVANSKQKVSADGTVAIEAASGTDYVVSAKKLSGNNVETIKGNIKVALAKNSVKTGKNIKVKVSLPDTVSTGNKFATEKATISYKSSKKGIASVSVKGVVKAKKKGIVTITTIIKLESGQKVTQKKKITIK